MAAAPRYQPTSTGAAAWRRFIDIELADCRIEQQMADRTAPAVTRHHGDWRKESAREGGTLPCQPLSSRYVTISNMTASSTPTNPLSSLLPTPTATRFPSAAIFTAGDQILTLFQCFPSLPCQQNFPDRRIFTSEHCLFSPSGPIRPIAC
jgi:hypothetical protein